MYALAAETVREPVADLDDLAVAGRFRVVRSRSRGFERRLVGVVALAGPVVVVDAVYVLLVAVGALDADAVWFEVSETSRQSLELSLAVVGKDTLDARAVEVARAEQQHARLFGVGRRPVAVLVCRCHPRPDGVTDRKCL
ncbi:hypothetical protein [Halobacterium jilantaiense]|uniref:hypothetical protein n=1 Tax=Halobacterium jilantaiense TaxID=355548 RepID=UPI00115FF7BA|nr:hypothetical protein [Halobacterium jilantaiense]